MGELGQESGEWPCVVLENPAWQPGRAQGGSCLQGLRALAGVGVLPNPASCLAAEHPPALPPSCLAVFTGPPDPLHGNSLNQKVRAAAQVSAGPTPTVPDGVLKPCLEWQGSSASQSPASGRRWGAWRSPALCPHPPLSRQDLASVLFSDAPLPQPAALPACPLPPTGKPRPLTALLPSVGHAGSAGLVWLPLTGAVVVQRGHWPGELLGLRAGCCRPW